MRYLRGFGLKIFLLTSPNFSSVRGNNDLDSVLNRLPPLLQDSDIAYFSSRYDLDGVHWALVNVFARSDRNPDGSQAKFTLPEALAARGAGNSYTSASKVAHDLEQANYLLEHSSSMKKETRVQLENVIIPTLKRLKKHIPPLEELFETRGLYKFKRKDYNLLGILNVYNKAFHVPEFTHIEDFTLSQSFHQQTEFFEDEWIHSDQPGILIIDDLLSQSALKNVQKIMMESTVFYQNGGGFVGAHVDDGLHQKILLAVAYELNKSLPQIFKGHDFKYLKALKYDSEYPEVSSATINDAAVTVTLWVTPEEANLDPETGGLIVFTSKPSSDWDFDTNHMNPERVIKDILEPSNYANVTIPYKMNRAAIYDSSFFSRTDKFTFKTGYENRRIDLTFLYGDFQKVCDSPTCANGFDLK